MTRDERIEKVLKKAVSKDQVHHAYLFCGSDAGGRTAMAKGFIRSLLCEHGGCGTCSVCRKVNGGNHPDVIYIQGREDKQLLVEDMKGIFTFLQRRPYEGDRKVVVITKADMIVDRAQKMILKILEEPSPGSVIILLAENPDAVAPTIASRCEIFRLADVTKSYGETASGYGDELFELLTGADVPFYTMKDLAYSIHAKRDRKLLADILAYTEERFRDRIVEGKSDNIASIYALEEAKRRSESNVIISNILLDLMLKAEDGRW